MWQYPLPSSNPKFWYFLHLCMLMCIILVYYHIFLFIVTIILVGKNIYNSIEITKISSVLAFGSFTYWYLVPLAFYVQLGAKLQQLERVKGIVIRFTSGHRWIVNLGHPCNLICLLLHLFYIFILLSQVHTLC